MLEFHLRCLDGSLDKRPPSELKQVHRDMAGRSVVSGVDVVRCNQPEDEQFPSFLRPAS
jgi:hypothetical protein